MNNLCVGSLESFKYHCIVTTLTTNNNIMGCGSGMSAEETLKKYKMYLCGEYTAKKTQEQYYNSAKLLTQITNNVITDDVLIQYQHYINQHYPKRNSRRLRLHGANQYLKWMGNNYRFKLPPQENTNQRTLNEKQIDQLLQISRYNPETQLVVMLLWDGCLRPNKIINLRLVDRNGSNLYLNQTKTGDKHIVMSNPLVDAWDNYLEHRPIPKHEYQDYLLIQSWINNQGEKYHCTHHIVQSIKRLGKIIGTNYTITPYTIRRTSATLRQNKFSKYYAGDPKLVQRMFNHSDIRTTMRYNQITDNDVQKYLDSLYRCTDKPYLSPHGTMFKRLCVENEDEDENFSVSFSTSTFFKNLVCLWGGFAC